MQRCDRVQLLPIRVPAVVQLRRLTFDYPYAPRSLVWEDDRLLDLLAGGMSVGLDGTTSGAHINWAYPFDRAQLSPSRRYSVFCVAMGTKGLLVEHQQRVLREINRSFYCADAYEYPVALGRWFDGTEVLAHCPDDYRRLVVETVDDGRRLASATANAADVFHSRLQFSPDGEHLLSAGWIWQPYGIVAIYDLRAAAADGSALDGPGVMPQSAIDCEVDAATWLDHDRIVISTNPEDEPFTGDSEGLAPGELGLWSLKERAWVARNMFDGATGTLHAFGELVLALYEHPRLVDPQTARVVAEWPELDSGNQLGSIIWGSRTRIPPVAVDAEHQRFAVGLTDGVAVVELA